VVERDPKKSLPIQMLTPRTQPRAAAAARPAEYDTSETSIAPPFRIAPGAATWDNASKSKQ